MYNGTLCNNKAQCAGGAIANYGGTVTVYNGKIHTNNTNWPGGHTAYTGGAGIWTGNDGKTTVSGPVMFYANHSGCGGAMMVYSASTVILDGVQIGLNTDTGYSGVREATSGTASTVTYTSGRYHTLNTYAPAIPDTAGSKITFDKNGGTIPAIPEKIMETYGEKYTLPTNNPERTGYTFAGWWSYRLFRRQGER